jgi:hypothetical protein
VFPGDAVDGGHVCWLPVQMDDEHGFGARRDRSFDFLWIQQAADTIDIGKHGHRADCQNTRRRRTPRARCRDDLIAIADF